jgi:hypothetical protein
LYRSETVTISIDCPVQAVYEFLADPRNLPSWLADIGGTIQQVRDEQWVVETPAGPYTFRFCPRNRFGVLDFAVFRADRSVLEMPVRVVANQGGTELMLTIHRTPDKAEVVHASEVEWIRVDLATLKTLLEARRTEAGELQD